MSREWIVAANTWDLHARINTKKAKPYPTPWPDPDNKKIGSKNQSRSNVIKNLERMNPKESNG